MTNAECRMTNGRSTNAGGLRGAPWTAAGLLPLFGASLAGVGGSVRCLAGWLAHLRGLGSGVRGHVFVRWQQGCLGGAAAGLPQSRVAWPRCGGSVPGGRAKVGCPSASARWCATHAQRDGRKAREIQGVMDFWCCRALACAGPKLDCSNTPAHRGSRSFSSSRQTRRQRLL